MYILHRRAAVGGIGGGSNQDLVAREADKAAKFPIRKFSSLVSLLGYQILV